MAKAKSQRRVCLQSSDIVHPRPFLRALLLLLAVVAVVASVIGGSPALAAPLRVRVRGVAKLAMRASREQVAGQPGVNELVLSGSLTDDAGGPLALQSVTVRVVRETDAHDGRVADALRHAQGCDRTADVAPGGAPAPRRGPKSWGVRVGGPTDAPEVILITDEDGRFCFRARLDPDRYKATGVFTPTSQTLLDGIEREISFDLSRRGLALRFDPSPRVVPLDAPQLGVEVVAIFDDDATPRVAPGLPLVLATEKGEVARAVTDATGRAHFVVPSVKLGPPGPGELRVLFPGDGETTSASQSVDIERHVKVALKVPTAERGDAAPGYPEDGIDLTTQVSSSLGPVAEGSVEARVGEVVVGAAPVERGTARLVLSFTAQGTEALVRLRYVPASPWYEPLGEPTIRLPIRGPSLWSKAPILIAGLAVLAFFLASRVTAQKNKPEPAPSEAKRDERDGKPQIEVVRPATSPAEGWTGRVVDAHDRTPIAGARVWIERGTFDGRTVLVSVETDRDGRFTIAGTGPSAGDEEMSAEARLHARLRQRLPPAGEVTIALALRRRALLARLVTWARKKGAPYDARPEPTPGHVKRAASAELDERAQRARSDAFTTARWADATERAVFGPGEVDRLGPNAAPTPEQGGPGPGEGPAERR